MNLKNKVYTNQFCFCQEIIQQIGQDSFDLYQKVILDESSIGRQRFQEKLGWLMDYENNIADYVQIIDLIKISSEQIKNEGLHEYSVRYFKESIQSDSLTSVANTLKEQIIEYMEKELNLPENDKNSSVGRYDFIPTSSDIIESLFGKYKTFLETRHRYEISKMILMFPLFVTNITNDLIKKAMESTRTIDVEKWANETLGASALAKRRAALG